MAALKIFFSWSSDNDSKVCRYLIRDALEDACKQLSTDLNESERDVQLDHDTKGETGSPSITDSIEKKIRECAIFVGDLTPAMVQRREGELPRLLPNANVMFELGFAHGVLGFDRIINVLNTAFAENAQNGPAKIKDGTLPFNLRHRRYPICFELKPGANGDAITAERKQLTKFFIGQFKPIVEKFNKNQEVVDEAPPLTPHEPASGAIATFLNDGVVFHPGRTIKWKNEPSQVYVRFIPSRDFQLSSREVEQACSKIDIGVPPRSTSGADYGRNSLGYVHYAVGGLDLSFSRDLIQFFRSGEVWAIFGTFLSRDPQHVSWVVEEIFAWASYQAFMFVGNFAYSGPAKMIFGLTNVQGRIFLATASDGNSLRRPLLLQDGSFQFVCDIQKATAQTIKNAAEQAARRLWEEAALERDPRLSEQSFRAQYQTDAPGYWRFFPKATS